MHPVSGAAPIYVSVANLTNATFAGSTLSSASVPGSIDGATGSNTNFSNMVFGYGEFW